jgi:predicted phosphodiesterase
MPSSFYTDILTSFSQCGTELDIKQGGKALIISDFHMGKGRQDDLSPNGELLKSLLENYYFQKGWRLVLNGDIEELAKFSYQDIRKEWAEMYRVFDLFASEGRLFKILGNHDEDLILEKNYPYPLYSALRIVTDFVPIYVYHGHQASRLYTDYNNLISLSLRYLMKPVGIRNISSARSPHRRFHVEQYAYNFSLQNNCISIIGHTHRSLFESLSRFDYIKFEIEKLCTDYPASTGKDRERIAAEVSHLRQELRKLRRLEKLDVLRNSLYGDELPVPYLFNCGSAIGKKGVNAIELDNETMALVYWFVHGKGMKFINRGWYKVEQLNNTPYYRSVLNHDRLDYIKAKIELLGKQTA